MKKLLIILIMMVSSSIMFGKTHRYDNINIEVSNIIKGNKTVLAVGLQPVFNSNDANIKAYTLINDDNNKIIGFTINKKDADKFSKMLDYYNFSYKITQDVRWANHVNFKEL